jgi:hypothetical protein
MPVRGVFATVAGATILARGGMPMKKTDLAELNRQVEELHRRQREESQRELDELFARSGFENGAEALEAFRDLFDSDEEMEEFGLYIQQMREAERARYRD